MFAETDILNKAVAILLFRAVAGFLFFFQGYDKLFNIKTDSIIQALNVPMSKFNLPSIFLRPAITLSSFVEMICGALLLLGFYKNISLYFLTGDLILVSFIFSFIKPMWDMQYFFPRLIMVSFLLFTATYPDIFSIDYLLK
jgi:uncharacterized membrane protein YphA (DoxX/SURF4 family)